MARAVRVVLLLRVVRRAVVLRGRRVVALLPVRRRVVPGLLRRAAVGVRVVLALLVGVLLVGALLVLALAVGVLPVGVLRAGAPVAVRRPLPVAVGIGRAHV